MKNIINLVQQRYDSGRPLTEQELEELAKRLYEEDIEIQPNYDKKNLKVFEVKTAGSERFKGLKFFRESSSGKMISHTLDYFEICYMINDTETEEPEQFKGLSRKINEFYETYKHLGFPEGYNPEIHEKLDFQI